MICPVCKEQMPLLSRVCPVCGNVVEGGDNQASATKSVEYLENILYRVKSLPEPSFSKSMGHMSLYMIPLLTLLVAVLWLISNAGLFLIIGAILAIWSIILVIKKLAGTLGNAKSNKYFAELKNEYEYSARSLQRDYGKNREIARLLEEINEQISSIEKRRKALTRRNFILWAIIFVLIAILASVGSFGVKSTVEDNVAIQWQEELQEFVSKGVNDEHDATLRTQLLEKIISANAMTEAEQFFNDYCMGLVGDMECAKKIVQYHISKGNKDAAEAFVKKCKLRYASDIEKLQNLLK